MIKWLLSLVHIGVILSLVILPAIFLNSQANAAQIFSNCGNNSAIGAPDVCKSAKATPDDNPIVTIIKVAIEIISYVVGAAAIIGILVSAVRFITASGNSDAIASARSGLIYSLVGVAVVVLAQVFVAFIINS